MAQELVTDEQPFVFLAGPGGPFTAPAAAGGGGTGEVFRGTGSPEGVVTSDSGDAVYYEEDTGAIWIFTGTAGTAVGWAESIGG